MKSASLYQNQFAALQRKQTEILADMAQVLSEARADGFHAEEIIAAPEYSAKQPEFDL